MIRARPVRLKRLTDIVVSLRGKSADQVAAEIQTAALKVCRAEIARVPLATLTACAADVAEDAMNQLPASQR